MNVIKDLLRIKLFREEKAELEVVRSKYALYLADSHLESSREILRSFQQESISREKEMYLDLCARIVALKDINSVYLEVELMKDKTERLIAAVKDAKEVRNSSYEKLEISRKLHREAVKTREKFLEIKKIQDKEATKETDRIEDIEIEESASNQFLYSDSSQKIDQFWRERDK